MASAPSLTKEILSAGQTPGRRDAVRVISFEEARQQHFRSTWQQLADAATEPNPFFEQWFLLPSLKAFGSNSISLFTTYADGTLVGLMPLGRTRSYYGYPIPHIATWLHANAFYGAPLVAKGHERDFWRSLFAYLDRQPGLALLAHLPHLDAEGPMDTALVEVLAEDRRDAALVNRNERAMLASDLSPEDYLAQSLSKKHTKELRRKRRRLSEQGDLAFERRDDAYAIDEWIAEFLALEAAGWKGDAGSALASDSETGKFSAEALRGAAHAGRLERTTLRLDGKPIAMLSSFVCPPGSFGFKTAFDETFQTYSPGMQLQIDNLAVLDRKDIEWLDSCAAEGHPMIDRLWTERRTLVTRNIAIGGRARRAIFSALMAFETRRRSKA
ncbi:GNAT family N-acetyltransferase [Erythrobacter sp. THAF29]|uniref:GNAT family N-acetyltransferase n=1 Tax=Erythrobacter sp. THAF29 TaxID=2587851 RepID=UPI0012683DD1|nr:GNAT family N-acetyltransferase [Erythrobacter sp. THAF29]